MDTPRSISLQAPRGELFADSGAAAVWAAIQLLSEESERRLLDAFIAEQLIPDVRASAHQTQIARALASLREAHDLLQFDPTLADDGDRDASPDAVTAPERPRLSMNAYR